MYPKFPRGIRERTSVQICHSYLTTTTICESQTATTTTTEIFIDVEERETEKYYDWRWDPLRTT
jgi:hypothetical protein